MVPGAQVSPSMNRLESVPHLRRAIPYILVGGVLACRGGALAYIDVDGSDRVVVEEGSIVEDLLGDLGFEGFVQMNVVASEELQNQGVEAGDISSVQLVSFELAAVEPADGDLSFFESVAVWVEAPGLDPVMIADAVDFDEGRQVVSFDVYDVDLTDYVVSESMTLTTDIVAGRPDKETVVEAAYLLDVGVTLQGAKKQACN